MRADPPKCWIESPEEKAVGGSVKRLIHSANSDIVELDCRQRPSKQLAKYALAAGISGDAESAEVKDDSG